MLILLAQAVATPSTFELALDQFDRACVQAVVERRSSGVIHATDAIRPTHEPAAALLPDRSARRVERCGLEASVPEAAFASYAERTAARLALTEVVPVSGRALRMAAWSKRLPDGRYLNVTLTSSDKGKTVRVVRLSMTRVD